MSDIKLVYVDDMTLPEYNMGGIIRKNGELILYDITGLPNDEKNISNYKFKVEIDYSGYITTIDPDTGYSLSARLYDPGSLDNQIKYGIELSKIKESIMLSIGEYNPKNIKPGDKLFISMFSGSLSEIKESKSLVGFSVIKADKIEKRQKSLKITYTIVNFLNFRQSIYKNIGDTGSITFPSDKNIVTRNSKSSGKYSYVISLYIENKIV